MQIEDFRGRGPSLQLEDYFAGSTLANGLIEDRFGRLKRSFSCRVEGERLEDGIRLEEDFVYSDGKREARSWRLTRVAADRYTGRANDVVGLARGRLEGSAFHWRYRLRVPIGRRSTVLTFDDWMVLQDDGLLLNRARAYKFGLLMAQVTIVFCKPEIVESALQVAAE